MAPAFNEAEKSCDFKTSAPVHNAIFSLPNFRGFFCTFIYISFLATSSLFLCSAAISIPPQSFKVSWLVGVNKLLLLGSGGPEIRTAVLQVLFIQRGYIFFVGIQGYKKCYFIVPSSFIVKKT